METKKKKKNFFSFCGQDHLLASQPINCDTKFRPDAFWPQRYPVSVVHPDDWPNLADTSTQGFPEGTA